MVLMQVPMQYARSENESGSFGKSKKLHWMTFSEKTRALRLNLLLCVTVRYVPLVTISPVDSFHNYFLIGTIWHRLHPNNRVDSKVNTSLSSRSNIKNVPQACNNLSASCTCHSSWSRALQRGYALGLQC